MSENQICQICRFFNEDLLFPCCICNNNLAHFCCMPITIGTGGWTCERCIAGSGNKALDLKSLQSAGDPIYSLVSLDTFPSALNSNTRPPNSVLPSDSEPSELTAEIKFSEVSTSYAYKLRIRNKLVDALIVYDALLKGDPTNVECLIGKGICLKKQQQGVAALVCFSEAVKIDPHNLLAIMHSGIVHQEEGRFSQALEFYRQSSLEDPSFIPTKFYLASVLTDIGTTMREDGKFDGAISSYSEALQINPHYYTANYNMGLAYEAIEDYDSAVDHYEKVVPEDSHYVDALCRIGYINGECRRFDLAIPYYERCLAISPNMETAKKYIAFAYTDLGNAAKEINIDQAIMFFEKALFHNSRSAETLYYLAVACTEMKAFDKAIFYYETAIAIEPSVEAFHNLALLHIELHNAEKAVNCFLESLKINPDFVSSLSNLGLLYRNQGKIEESIRLFKKITTVDPSFATAFKNLGALYGDIGKVHKAIKAFDKYLEIRPDSWDIVQNKLCFLNFVDQGHDHNLYEKHRELGVHLASLSTPYTSWDNLRESQRPITIGYISPDLYSHSVSFFIEVPLMYHNYKEYRVVVFSTGAKVDKKTERLKDLVSEKGGDWQELYGRSEDDIGRVIRDAKIDILVELSGHTVNNKLQTLACKPAPVQVTWIGYPNTTGLATIDYRITDSFADPSDTKQKFVEELIRLPDTFLCYSPPLDAGCVVPAPMMKNGYVTFGSFNNIAKITHEVLELWAEVLHAVPYSHLVLKCKAFFCDRSKQRFLAMLGELGIESKRVDLLPLMVSSQSHMQAYSLMDISLDTFPYAGTTTTCESLYMGVPCITLAGSVHSHNVGVSILSNLGLQHLVARDKKEYVKIASSLAHFETLDGIKRLLRERMVESPLCNGPLFVDSLESAYRNMWVTYCGREVS